MGHRSATMGFPPSLFAAAALLGFASAPFPAVDIPKLCTDAVVAVDADRAEAACRRQEAEARTKLRALWAKLSASERAVCVGEAELGTARSYADILGCIETSRELARENAPKAPR